MRKIVCIIIFLFLGYQSVLAETITVDVNVKSFYTKGRTAYEKGLYVEALKYLFAFRLLLSQNELKKHLDLSREIDIAISNSERVLYDALMFKEKETGKKLSHQREETKREVFRQTISGFEK